MMEKSGATANNKNHAFSLFLDLPGCNPNPLFVTKPKDNRFEIKNKHAEIKVVERILLKGTTMGLNSFIILGQLFFITLFKLLS